MFAILRKLSARNSLVMQWLGFCVLLPRVQVQPQGRELRSTELYGQNKMKQKPPPPPIKSLSGYPKCAHCGWQRLILMGLKF